MHSSDLKRTVLLDPVRNGADKLCIVSGYATPGMASWHIQELNDCRYNPISIDLIVGMCVHEGLTLESHKGFVDVIENFSSVPDYSQFNCQYVYKGPPLHSKLYVWLRNENPFLAFAGSPNYTQSAFSRSRREIITECDPDQAYEYFGRIESDTVFCTNGDVEECIRFNRKVQVYDYESGEATDKIPEHGVTLSLLARDGETGSRSGLNWGQRSGREPNQAYIPLPASIARTGFFPLNKQHFTVLTDDNKSLILRVEQQNNKAITTPENNSRIGEYFRYRLGLPNGAYITRDDLERYGRTDVTFYKIDDEQFFMDFSSPSG